MPQLSSLERAIVSVIAYFDIFHYPVTVMEIDKWLYFESDKKQLRTTLGEIQSTLDQSEQLARLIGQRQGFYFLKGREQTVGERIENYKIAEGKFKRGLRFTRFLRFLPFIKMVAICNSLAFSQASPTSDIDFFIITERRRMWTVRFLSALVPALLGWRPKVGVTKDKICLTFFVSEDRLDLQDLALVQPDIYFMFWITQIVPIYDPGLMYGKFLAANGWIQPWLPLSIPVQPAWRRRVIDTPSSRLLKRSFAKLLSGRFGDFIERHLKAFQLKRLPAVLRTMANQDQRVVINDQVLKFHDNDRRRQFRKMFLDRIQMINNS